MVEGGDKTAKATEPKKEPTEPVEAPKAKLSRFKKNLVERREQWGSRRADPEVPSREQLQQRIAIEMERLKPRRRLTTLIVGGVILITLLGAGLAWWVAWIESRQAFSAFEWASEVDGDGWFNAARTSATFMAVLGVGGAAVVGYRRQHNTELTRLLEHRRQLTAEAAQETAAEQAATASEQLALDSSKYQLDRERQMHEREREMRERFATVSAQLDDDSSTTQSAGLYGIAALADDWRSIGNEGEMRVCVDIFCAHLRSVSRWLANAKATEKERVIDEDRRQTLELVLGAGADVLRRKLGLKNGAWKGVATEGEMLDLSGGFFPDVTLESIDFSNFNLSRANFASSRLSGSRFKGADLTYTNFSDIFMFGGSMRSVNGFRVDFTRATLDGVSFEDGYLHGAILKDADIYRVSFEDCDLADANLETECYEEDSKLPNFNHARGLHEAALSESLAAKIPEHIEWSRNNDGD